MSAQQDPILVVDDTEEVRTVLRDALQRAHYSVDIAPDALGGLALQAGRGYALILCDLQMPDINGIEFCRRVLQAHPEMRGRLVLMTGGIGLDRAGLDFRPGEVRTLIKPFSLPELYHLVREIMGPPESPPGQKQP